MFFQTTSVRPKARNSGERGASVVEYTLLIGIVATVGIGAMRTIGGGLAGESDPCKPGFLVRAAQVLGEPHASQLTCQPEKSSQE
jgi:hypothetical protein